MSTNIEVKNHTMIYYPPDELKQLRKLLKLRGVQEQIYVHTRIAKSTVSRIARRGMGTQEKVDQLRSFVEAFRKSSMLSRGSSN